MKKILNYFLVIITFIVCVGCTNTKELTQDQIDLITNTKPTGSLSLFDNMIKDGYEKEYDQNKDVLMMRKEKIEFAKSTNELKFTDENGEYIYLSEVKDKKNQTLFNLANILETYEINMADVNFVFDIEYEMAKEKNPKQYKSEIAQKLIKAGYELSDQYQRTKDDKGYLYSTWKREWNENKNNITCYIDFINKTFTYEFSKDLHYVYYWNEQKASVNTLTQILVYNVKTQKIEATKGLDKKTKEQYLTQVMYIYQEYQNEMKRIGITHNESQNYEGEKE